MREILFRGKCLNTGEWVFGDTFTHNNGDVYIYSREPVTLGTRNTVRVVPETVGEYTGVEDSLRTRIFEGDVVREKFLGEGVSGECLREVVFLPGSFVAEDLIYRYPRLLDDLESPEIIGNIYDNHEFNKI